MDSNPFAPTTAISEDFGVFGDAILVRKGFLHRIIRFSLSSLATPSTTGRLNKELPSKESGGGPSVPIDPSYGRGGDPLAVSGEGTLVELVYNGWWFLQRVHLNNRLVWWAISWTTIRSRISVNLSEQPGFESELAAGFPGHLRIEINFIRGLRIRRFRVWLDDQIRYDEIC